MICIKAGQALKRYSCYFKNHGSGTSLQLEKAAALFKGQGLMLYMYRGMPEKAPAVASLCPHGLLWSGRSLCPPALDSASKQHVIDAALLHLCTQFHVEEQKHNSYFFLIDWFSQSSVVEAEHGQSLDVSMSSRKRSLHMQLVSLVIKQVHGLPWSWLINNRQSVKSMSATNSSGV